MYTVGVGVFNSWYLYKACFCPAISLFIQWAYSIGCAWLSNTRWEEFGIPLTVQFLFSDFSIQRICILFSIGILHIGVSRTHFTAGYTQEIDSTVEKYSPDFATFVDFCNPIGKYKPKMQKDLLLLNVVSSSDVGFAAGKTPKAAKFAAISTLLWSSWFPDHP